MGLLKLAAFGIAGLVAAANVLAFLFQERLIFYPEALDPGFEFRFSRPFEEISIAREGAVLNALRFRAENPKGIVVYFHGNAGSLRDWGEVGAELAADHGYDVLIYDYRGYGKSTGRHASESEMLDDARAVVALARRDFPEEKIVLFGRSLGSGIAVRLAAETRAKRLLLESPYRSIASVARSQFPIVLPFALKYPFRSDVAAARVKAPVSIFHGTADEVLAFAEAERLARDFSPPATFVAIPGGRHNDLDAFPEYRTALAKALAD